MPVLSQQTETTVIASRSTASTAPVSGDAGYLSNLDGGMVRTFVDKVSGTISACTVRMYTRAKGGTTWGAGDLFTVDTTLLTAASRVSIDWLIGEEEEATFAFETLTGGGNASLSAKAVRT